MPNAELLLSSPCRVTMCYFPGFEVWRYTQCCKLTEKVHSSLWCPQSLLWTKHTLPSWLTFSLQHILFFHFLIVATHFVCASRELISLLVFGFLDLAVFPWKELEGLVYINSDYICSLNQVLTGWGVHVAMKLLPREGHKRYNFYFGCQAM